MMDKRIRTFVELQRTRERKIITNKTQNKRQNTGRAYAAGTGVLLMQTLLITNRGHWDRSEATCYECGMPRTFIKMMSTIRKKTNRGNPAGHLSMLRKSVAYQAIIICAEKIVLISWGNETLIVHGDRSNRGNEAHLHLISYTKIHEYTLKGCPVFLANVTTKETEDKSEKKRLKDVSMVRDFPNVFPKDFPGLPLTRHVKFQIDLIPGAAPVAWAP
ncbi:hypothetical protein Tco_0922185 [Tanacetum coccineum]|uniref:Reverse transcriptase domain-containing protein n=1 Tax=Tanacetum coccineum TaxID=301880 RepID=A0ABQ5CXF9_9ASTR